MKPRDRVRRAAGLPAVSLLLAAAAASSGCGSGPSGSMVAIPPPQGWTEALLRSRAEKDAYFKTDPTTPLMAADRAAFEGLDYWDPDPRFYYVGQVNAYLQPERFEIVTTSGKPRPCERIGWVGFEVDGQSQRLQVYRLLDQPPRDGGVDFFVPFMDATTGQESYPAGRYVELQGPEGGPYVLDFNQAYNPWCAYGEAGRYVCPVTPQENRLSVRIEAGERGYRAAPEDAAAEAG